MKLAGIGLIVAGVVVTASGAAAHGIPIDEPAMFIGAVVMLPAGVAALISAALRGKDFE